MRASSPLALRCALAVSAAFTACAGVPVDHEGVVPTPSGDVFVRARGRGPVLVLLHGLGDSSVGWRKVEAPLRDAGFRVVVWDALGAGRAAKPPDGDYHLEAHVDRLRAVLDALGVRRATLIGNSLGGSVALLFALRHPERVERLVLLDPAAYPEGGWTGTWLWESGAGGVLHAVPPAWIASLALRMNFGDPSRIGGDDLDTYTAEAARPGTIDAFLAQQRQLMPSPADVEPWIAGYRSLAIPTLILWGTKDRVLSPELGHRLLRDLPHARLVLMDVVGHVPQQEAPQRVLDEVLAFVGG